MTQAARTLANAKASPTTTVAPQPTAPPTDISAYNKYIPEQTGGGASGSWADPDDLEVVTKRRGVMPEVRKSSELVAAIAGMRGPELRELQEKLFKSGYYGKAKRNQIAWGAQADSQTMEAYEVAIGRAAQIYAVEKSDYDKAFDKKAAAKTPTSVEDVLDMSLQTEEDGDGEAAEPNIFKVDNTEDLQAVIKSSARQVIGRNVSQATIDRLTESFQQLQVSKQAEAVNAVEAAPAGGAVVIEETGTMDPKRFAEEQVAKDNPQEAQAKQMNDAYEVFTQLLGQSQNRVIQS